MWCSKRARFSLQLISTYATESTQDREIQKWRHIFRITRTYIIYVQCNAITRDTIIIGYTELCSLFFFALDNCTSLNMVPYSS